MLRFCFRPSVWCCSGKALSKVLKLDKNRIGRIVARRASEREGDIADIRKAENSLVMAKLCHGR